MIQTVKTELYFGLTWMAHREPVGPVIVTGLGRSEAEAIADLETREAHSHEWKEVEPGIEQCTGCHACRSV